MNAAETITLALRLEPEDVLFFRDGRPFDAADTAFSGFPTPQALHGMIKTRLMRHFGLTSSGSLHRLRHSENDPLRWIAELKTRGPWPCSAGMPYLPAPDCLFQKKESCALTLISPLLEPALPGWLPPCDGMKPLWNVEPGEWEPAEGWVAANQMAQLLQGKSDGIGVKASDEIWASELRECTAIEPGTQSAKPHQLYTASMLRLNKGWSFYCEIVIPAGAEAALKSALPEGEALPFGGEGRRIRLYRVACHPWPVVEPEEDRLLTVLITPLMPSPRANPGLAWLPAHAQGTLISAACRAPLPVSGWSLANTRFVPQADNERSLPVNGPKPTRFAVRAGGCYFWRSGSGKSARRTGLIELGNTPLDTAVGWGLALTGSWQPAVLKNLHPVS